MIKYTSFKAIPQFTRAGSYAVDIPLDRVPKWVANEQEDPGLVLTPEFQRAPAPGPCSWLRERLY